MRATARIRRSLPAFDFQNEENLAARPHRLGVADFEELAVDGDGGFFLEVFAQPPGSARRAP